MFADKKTRRLNVICSEFHLQRADLLAFFCKSAFGIPVVVVFIPGQLFLLNGRLSLFPVKHCSSQKFMIGYNTTIIKYLWIPYLFEYKSHFFVPKYHPKNQVRLIHEYMKCIICRTKFFEVFPCYVFLRCLLSYDHITYCLLCE